MPRDNAQCKCEGGARLFSGCLWCGLTFRLETCLEPASSEPPEARLPAALLVLPGMLLLHPGSKPACVLALLKLAFLETFEVPEFFI